MPRGLIERARREARDESGTTLIELLVTTLIAMIVFGAILGLVDVSLKASRRVSDRVEIVQRGRTALEQITQRLRSQVCLGQSVPALVAANSTSVTFHANLGSEDFTPELRRLSVVNDSIIEDFYAGQGTAPSRTFPGYPSTPTRTRTIITNVAQVGTTPWFRYFAFTGSDPITPSDELGVPVSTANLGRVVQIEVAFRALPTSSNPPPANITETTFQSHVYVRTADPTDPVHSPQCI